MNANDSVEVYQSTNPPEAEMLVSMLRAEGIRALTEGGSPIVLTGIEQVTILVNAEDADRARKLLENYEKHGHAKGHHHPPKRD